MITLLYNTDTNTAGPMRNGPYLVDGQPGELPAFLVELTVVQEPMPQVGEYEVAQPATRVELPARQYVQGWMVRPMTEAEIEALNPVPEEVAAWRLRFVVAQAGLKDSIDGGITALPEPARTLAREAWYNGTTIRRDSTLVNAMAEGLEIAPATLDELFRQAAALAV
jgi:hypothetical protein